MKADFDDIIGTQIISGELFFKFKYDVAPKIRLVSEKLAPKNLISQHHWELWRSCIEKFIIFQTHWDLLRYCIEYFYYSHSDLELCR